jgi:hypothetical protein
MNTVALKSFVVFRPGKNINTVKLCKKCKHFIPNKDRCQLFGNMDLVTGDMEYNYASSERVENGNCGPEAKFWIPIPPININNTEEYCTIP